MPLPWQAPRGRQGQDDLRLEGPMLWALLTLSIAAALFVAGLPTLALGAIALGVLVLVAVRPAWGIAIVLSAQAWDQIFNSESGSETDAYSVGRILAVVTVLAYGRVWLQTRPRLAVSSPIVVLFCAFVGWCGITVLWSPDQFRALTAILKIALQIAFVYAGLGLLSNRVAFARILLIATLLTTAAAMYCIVSAISGGTGLEADSVAGGPETRLRLLGTGINALAIQFGYAIVFAFAYSVLEGGLAFRVAALACVPVLFVTALRCGTRAVLLGVPAALAIASVLVYGRSLDKAVFRLLVVGVLLVGVFLFAVDEGLVRDRLLDRLLTVGEMETYESNVRLTLWRDGIDYWLLYPFGTGVGNEELAYTGSEAGEAHNVFVSCLVQTGFVGLGLFAAALGLLAWRVWRIGDRSLRFGALSLLLCMLSQAVHGTIMETRLFWWPVLIMLLVVEIDSRWELPRNAVEPERSTRTRYVRN